MPQIERRYHFPKSLEVRAASEPGKPLTIRGYAAVFYKPGDPSTQFERGNGVVERIMPGAFDAALVEDDVRCLNNHEEECVLGRRVPGSDKNTLRLGVDSRGLWYECDLDPTRESIYRSIERGDVTGSSFSFACRTELGANRGKDVWEEINGVIVRSIYDLTLLDVSPVTFPAYEGATAEARSASLSEVPALLSEVESEDELLLA
jgi:HK97 family phage prohead protease